jgi:hypothetical protein
MLVTSVKQQHCLTRNRRVLGGGWPMAIEKFDAIMSAEALILSDTHVEILMLVSC